MTPAPPNRLTALIRLSRPRNALGLLLCYSIGVAITAPASFFTSTDYAVGFTILVCLNAAATFINDVADIKTDTHNQRSTALLRGIVSRALVTHAAYTLFALSALLAAISHDAYMHLVFVSLFILGGMVYSFGTHAAMRRPIASVVTLSLCTAALPYIYGVLVAGGSPRQTIALLLSLTLTRTSLHLLKDFKDEVGDRHAGKQTFLLQYGRRPTVYAGLVLACLGIAALGYQIVSLESIAWLPLLVPYAALLAYRFYRGSSASNKYMNRVFAQLLFAQNILDVGLVAWLVMR